MIFPKTVICLTSIGAAPGSSYFQNGSYFCWVVDQTYCDQRSSLTPEEPPSYRQLAVESGHLRFYIENQGVYEWSTLPHGDDPPVFGRHDCRRPWEQENFTLSEHLILVCLFEALISHAKYGASSAWLEEQKFAEIVKRIPPLAVGPWR